ncbi:MAG: sigma-70 family RNA polymerase sigma factor, partial [Halothece sp.]
GHPSKLEDGSVVPYLIRLYEKYDPTISSFKTYAYSSLYDAILEKVRQGQEAKRNSDWGLLKRSSKKALKIALQQVGVSYPQLSHCVIAWQGFKAVYADVTPGKKRQLSPPTNQQLEAITTYFKERSLSPGNVNIEELLSTCIHALRRYYETEFSSLNAVYEDTGNGNPLIAEISEHKFSQELEQTQTCQYHRQLRTILRQELHQLDKAAKLMLLLEYGLDKFPQKHIADIFGIQQYTVSRQVERYKRPLRQALIQWSQQQSEIVLTPKDVHQWNRKISTALDDWLMGYYRTFSSKLLQRCLIHHHRQDIPLLYSHFNGNGKALSSNELVNQSDFSEIKISEKMTAIETFLEQYLLNLLEKELIKSQLNFSHQTRNALKKPITALVKAWLQEAPYALLYQSQIPSFINT